LKQMMHRRPAVAMISAAGLVTSLRQRSQCGWLGELEWRHPPDRRVLPSSFAFPNLDTPRSLCHCNRSPACRGTLETQRIFCGWLGD
jgi:hypothetical protein